MGLQLLAIGSRKRRRGAAPENAEVPSKPTGDLSESQTSGLIDETAGAHENGSRKYYEVAFTSD